MTVDDVKPDAATFHRFLDTLSNQPWLGDRYWWPNYLFHFTDIKNVVNILNHGFLCSRYYAVQHNLIQQDSASSQIIEQTDSELTDYVRFYFRPLTPTAYQTEGIRPKFEQYHDAHCPVPVYLLFDHRKVIALKESKFSDGSLARHNRSIFDSAADFQDLPFRDIYHNTGWGSEVRERQDEIKNRRHAEVIVPSKISLDHLEYIVCRSQAEYETLYNLLSPSLWNQWRPKIAVSTHRRLFNREWLYVKEVSLNVRRMEVSFNFPARRSSGGPFSLRVDVNDNITGGQVQFEKDYENVVEQIRNAKLGLDLSNLSLRNFSARVFIDGHLAYFGNYMGDDIPF